MKKCFIYRNIFGAVEVLEKDKPAVWQPDFEQYEYTKADFIGSCEYTAKEVYDFLVQKGYTEGYALATVYEVFKTTNID